MPSFNAESLAWFQKTSVRLSAAGQFIWFVICERAKNCPSCQAFHLKRLPRPRRHAGVNSTDVLERLGEVLAVCLRCLKPTSHPGWRWIKPTIVDEGWRVSENIYVHRKRSPWPYPRPELSRDAHTRIAYLHPWSQRLDLLPLGNAGDAARVWRIIRWERGRRPPGKPAKRGRPIDPAGNLIPIDHYWPRPWRFPGWYPRPRKTPKSAFVFIRKGRDWIPLDDPNTPEFQGDG
jgi:hypothetical protein